MFKRIKAKKKARKFAKDIRDFLSATADYETKEISILEEDEKGVYVSDDSKVIKMHCESVGRESKTQYIVIDTDTPKQDAYYFYLMLSVALKLYRSRND